MTSSPCARWARIHPAAVCAALLCALAVVKVPRAQAAEPATPDASSQAPTGVVKIEETAAPATLAPATPANPATAAAADGIGAGPPMQPPQLVVVEPKVVRMAASVAGTVSSTMAQAAAKEGLKVLTYDEAKLILSHQANVQLLGGDADGASLAEIGRALGAPHVLAAVVTAIDNDTLVQMRLIDVTRAQVVSRREVRASAFDGSLTAAVEAATRLGLQPLSAGLQGTLQLAISEEGANVLIDEEQVGTSPLGVQKLAGGHHMLTVTKEGFIRHQETFQITQGAQVQRDIRLRPSIEFMQDYRARNGLFRTLAWTTTGLVVPLAAAAGTLGYFYDAQGKETVRIHNDLQKLIDDEGIGEFDPRYTAAQQQILDSRGLQQTYGYIAVASGTLGLITAAGAAYFWLFGQDPERYAEFEDTP